MVIVNGIRYTEDDAKRRGLKADDTVEHKDNDVKVIRASAPSKARTVSSNKARTSASEETK